MKKVMLGLFALILAFGAVAFTRAEKAPKANLFWFLTDASGNQIVKSTVPTATSTDPAGCPVSAAIYCSRGYSAYEKVPGSSPAQYRGKSGTEVETHMKN